MDQKVELLNVVALTRPRRSDEGRQLLRGQVGTAVEILAEDVFLIEFSDNSGASYAFASVPTSDLMVLHDQPAPEPVTD